MVKVELQAVGGDDYPRASPYSVPVLLKRVVLACGCGSRGSVSTAVPRVGGLRKTANVIHPPPTTSSNAPKTETSSGRGAVRSGAWRGRRARPDLRSAPDG